MKKEANLLEREKEMDKLYEREIQKTGGLNIWSNIHRNCE